MSRNIGSVLDSKICIYKSLLELIIYYMLIYVYTPLHNLTYRKTSIKCRVTNKCRGSKANVLINAGYQLNAEVSRSMF